MIGDAVACAISSFERQHICVWRLVLRVAIEAGAHRRPRRVNVDTIELWVESLAVYSVADAPATSRGRGRYFFTFIYFFLFVFSHFTKQGGLVGVDTATTIVAALHPTDEAMEAGRFRWGKLS
jgi:hypothetical protein